MIRKEIKFVLLGLLVIVLLYFLFFYGVLDHSIGRSTSPPLCTPVCIGDCGPDGCGGSCGTCPKGESCDNGICIGVCIPDTCSGLGYNCGVWDNGCARVINCGTCPAGDICENGACVPVPYCGDRTCNNGETCATCAGDCGACPPDGFEEPFCGDYTCDADETPANCPTDCHCGDEICEIDETPANCPTDCENPTPSVCGNNYCEIDETPINCPEDCELISSVCGNNYCEIDETPINCPEDCENPLVSVCGNNYCEFDETPINCPEDCFIQENPPTTEICYDTDSGINYEKKGAVSYLGENADNCIGEIIEEYYCTEGGHLGIYHYYCPGGCSNGACIAGLSQSPICVGEECNKGLNFFTKIVDFFKRIFP